MDKYFSKIALEASDRALNLLDRNAYSKTFGCFDKYYWHFKTKDFPSSSYQMGVQFLAQLYSDPTNSSFYKNPQLLDWIKASLRYTLLIQNKDGSFDEWYPNERGWAGPSSYVIHALISAYNIVQKELEPELKHQIQNCCFKTGHFLIKQKEGAKLANHYALFLLSLFEIDQVSPSPAFKQHYKKSLKNLSRFVYPEGWSIEYDSVDFGYNLATLSFLARLHKLDSHPFFENYAKKSFNFLSYFFYPDGSFGGLGSRETIHLYPYALKYWGQSLPLAGRIYHHLKNKNSFERLKPQDQDDHYLFYRLSEYFLADSIKDPVLSKNSLLPFAQKKPFTKHFLNSGFFIYKSDSFYLVCNLKKGGALRVYNSGQCLLKNKGWVAKMISKNRFPLKAGMTESAGMTDFTGMTGLAGMTKGDRLFTSFWYSDQNKIHIGTNQISVEGRSAIFSQKYFNPVKLILFRILNILSPHYLLAFGLKKAVRWLLIPPKTKKGLAYKRSLHFEEQKIMITDEITSPKALKIFYGGNFNIRYVPQSHYFETSDLQNPSQIFYLKDKKSTIQQICHPKSSNSAYLQD